MANAPFACLAEAFTRVDKRPYECVVTVGAWEAGPDEGARLRVVGVRPSGVDVGDVKRIAGLLVTVMDRRTKETKEGKRSGPSHRPAPPDPMKLKQGLGQLGQTKRLRAEAQWSAEGKRGRPGLKALRPEDLPPGVRAVRGYDQRGHCLKFEHDALGELGKIVLIKIRDGQTLVQAELYNGQEAMDTPLAQRKQQLFGQVVATVSDGFQKNFPE